MNRAQKATYRATMLGVHTPLMTYHKRELKKKRSIGAIAKDFGVSSNSYRAWLRGKVIPDLNNMHDVVAKLREAGLGIGAPIMTYLRDNPPVEKKEHPSKGKKLAPKLVAARSKKKKPRKQVKRKQAKRMVTRTVTVPSPIEDMLRTMVREEVQKVLDGVSVKIQT